MKIFDGEVIKRIVTDKRVKCTADKYFTRKVSALKWLNETAHAKDFKGFEIESFYNNAWQQIWCQGQLPATYDEFSKQVSQGMPHLQTFLEIVNEVAFDALGIDANGIPLTKISGKKADYIFRASGLRAWIIGTKQDSIKLRLENGSISDWIPRKEVEAITKRI